MVTPANKVTLARILAIPVFVTLLYLPHPFSSIVAAIVFSLIAVTDVVDGCIARRTKKTSAVGAVLDPLADKLLVCAALIFLVGKGIDAWMAYVIIAREFLVTGLRLIAPEVIVAHFLGKLKTGSQIVAVVWILLGLPFGWYALLVATGLTVVSGIEYVWIARKVWLRKL